MKMIKQPFSRLISLLIIIGTALSTGFLTSCKDDEEAAPNTIVDVAAGNTNFEILTAAIKKAGLESNLRATGPFTVFAPTDAAFVAYLGVADEASAKTAVNALSGQALTDLTNTLLYHVANGKTLSTGLSNNQQIPTLYTAGGSLTVVISGSQIAIRDNNTLTADAIVTTPNVNASNGVIHGIDKVLVPIQSSILQIAAANTDFNILVAAVTKAGLTGTTALGGTGPFTVFAPTDAAFIAYLKFFVSAAITDEAGAIAAINGLTGTDLQNLTNVLLYHVVSGTNLAASLTNNQSLTTLLTGKNSTVLISGSSVKIKDLNNATADANVVIPNIIASNGVIHAIDQVLVPTSATITQIVVASSDFDILEAAVVRAGLASALGGTTNYTVFAPTDAAFIKYIQLVLNLNIADEAAAITAVNSLSASILADILQYHVVAGNIKAAGLTTGSNVAVPSIRANNNTIYVTKVASPLAVSVNGAKVTTADVEASNGTVHIVDQVIIPPAGTVVVTAQADSRFTTLVAAVVKTGLVDALNGAGPLTVFAPTNTAFAALPITQFQSATAINALDANNPNDLSLINTLREVLLYHVISARAFSTNLTAGPLTTIKANTPNAVTIALGTGVTVTGAGNGTNASNVIIPNFTTTNGVIHAIDRVLLFQ